MRHRGPDDLGEFHWQDERSAIRVDLGLVRLAILDLSPAGHQPMSLPGGRFTISFNGEITNYVELRDELIGLGHSFVSGSDTEVLLRAWAEWGTSTLDRLEGMYAFAVLDTLERTITLARDPYGIKPLFYTSTVDRVAFCSDLRSLLAMAVPEPKLDWQVAVDYLQWGAYDYTELTFVEGVRQLLPGHYVVVSTETGQLGSPTRYWWPSVATTFTGSYQDAADTVRELFLDSVRRNLRSDVPIGIALSGGIDSSAVVGAVRHLEPNAEINTFSFIAPGYERSEDEWIDLMVADASTRTHTVTVREGDLERDLDDLILCQGEPFGSTSIYAQYRVFQLAHENGITVSLEGQGADEMLAGYEGYPAQRMHTLLETGRLPSAAKFANAWRQRPNHSLPPLLMETAAEFLPRSLRRKIHLRAPSPLLNLDALKDRDVSLDSIIVGQEPVRGARLKTYLRTSMTRYGLPKQLREGDRNSMRFSIEGRVPFLDRRLSEFVLTLPEEWILGPDATTKRIFRDAVRGLVPDAILDRRDKVGFDTPADDWVTKLANQPVDPDHPVGFLKPGRANTLTGGLSEAEVRWGENSHWRLINLRRWVALLDIDAR